MWKILPKLHLQGLINFIKKFGNVKMKTIKGMAKGVT